MNGTKKNLSGSVIVIGILLLAGLGTGITWRNYAIQAPSTREAKTVEGGKVEGVFAAGDAAHFTPGMKAIVTVEGLPEEKLLGVVEEVKGTVVRVRLKNAPGGWKSEVKAQVTVDTSVPVEEAKAD